MIRHLAPVVFMASFFSWACDEPKAETLAPPPRFEAVTKKAAISEKDLDGFCDLRAKPAAKLPAISGGTEPKGARWINLWATWCKSCVEEMPMIERWKKEHEFSVLYVSTDESAETLQSFLKKHPEIPSTATMNDPETLTGWMKEIGLDEGAGLPLHLFIGSDGSLACARAAAVSEHHLPLIKSLLK
jgi:thiol-disulfide isomerase/thioredoxin